MSLSQARASHAMQWDNLGAVEDMAVGSWNLHRMWGTPWHSGQNALGMYSHVPPGTGWAEDLCREGFQRHIRGAGDKHP